MVIIFDMKQIGFLVFLSFCTWMLNGHSQGFFAAFNTHKYFDFKTCEGHCSKKFNPGEGFTVGFAWNNQLTNSWQVHSRVFAEQYHGEVRYADGGNGGSDAFYINVMKTTLGLTIIPWVFHSKMNLKLDMGATLNMLLYDDTVGRRIYSRLGQPSRFEGISNVSENYLASLTAGLTFKLQYDIRIQQKWMLCPFYTFYFGLTNEFKNLDTNVKSMRNSFGLSVGWE